MAEKAAIKAKTRCQVEARAHSRCPIIRGCYDGKTTEKAIVSVKGGVTVSVIMIRDLAHVVDREKAKFGLFITLAEPTKPMQTEAVKTGYFETPYAKYPKIQILTIAELFAGAKPNIPLIDPTAFKKSAKELTTKQHDLF